jgi:hypothetical protein
LPADTARTALSPWKTAGRLGVIRK